MSGYIDHLARELPACSLEYVRKNHPSALKAAQRYNATRRAITFDDPSTITRAREAKRKLLAAIEGSAA